MNKRLAIIFILLTVVIDSMGIGLIMPVMPELIQELLGEVSLAEAAIWGGILSASFAVMQFLCGPAVGNLSDRFGRKPVLLASLVIVGVDYLVMGWTGSIWVLLIARIIAGIASATQSTANAYIADISDPKEKAQNFGLIGAAFGVGFILGPLLGGLLSEFGSRAPFFAAAALAGANFLFGAVILSETVTDRIRRALEWRRINPFGALQEVRKLPMGLPLLTVFLLHSLAFYAYPAVWAYFTIEQFGWSPFEVGISLGVFGMGLVAVQGFLIRKIIPAIGEWKALIYGLIVGVIADVLVGISWEGWMIYALIPLTSISFLTTPSLQGIMSKATPDDAQGELQGVLTSAGAIATIIAPLGFTALFWWFSASGARLYFPGAPYIAAGVLDLIALILVLALYKQLRKTRAEDLNSVS
ncbi:MAG: TCR/Tet family MFS transporter [Pseudomonadota bacterium]